MNGVFDFLLPSTGFEYVFAGMLSSWTILCFWAAHKARQSIEGRVNATHFKNIRSNVHDLTAAARHPVWDHLVENGPGFALVLGLLGTFLGIGMAIQGAGAILSHLSSGQSAGADLSQTVGDLSPMLAEIGLKFKSSAWGILVHIVLRVGMPVFKLEEIRLRAILSEMERDAQEEKGAQEKIAKDISDLVLLLRSSLFTKGDKRQPLAELLSKNNQHLSEVAEVQKSFGANVDKLGSSLTEFQSTISTFRTEMGESIKDMSEGVTTAVTSIEQSVHILREGLANELKNISRVASDLKTHTATMTVATEEQVKVMREMSDSTREITANGARYAINLSEVADALSSKGTLTTSLEKLIQETKSAKDEKVRRLEVLIDSNKEIVNNTKRSITSKLSEKIKL